ncbi:MAG: caspase family protein [Kofleriaceae bacterium]
MRRALVICSGFDLKPEMLNSAACAAQMLRTYEFDVTPCIGAEATRQGICDAYGALIEASAPADAAVVYYVGHGGLAVNSRYTPDDDLARVFQHINPTDFGETTDDEFRGISALELSLLLATLTAKTPNATTIFECCYAAQMSRGDAVAAAPAPTPTLTRIGVTNHLRALRDRARGLPLRAIHTRSGSQPAARASQRCSCGSRMPRPLRSDSTHRPTRRLDRRDDAGARTAAGRCPRPTRPLAGDRAAAA